jgi:hypothetical protein
MSLKVFTDLNDFNKILGLAWRKDDEEQVGLAVAPLADFLPPGRIAPSRRSVTLALCTMDGAYDFAKGRAAGYASAVRLSCRLGDLRDVCRGAIALALKDPDGLRAFEPVVLEFRKGALAVRCAGGEWNVRGDRFQFRQNGPS